ncbi:MAG: nitrous oxide reductase family maturation protein NosD, partial [Promethearchaeota archaeon]
MKPVVPLSLILLLMLNLFLIPSSILIAEAQRHSAPIEIPSFLVSKVINPKISYYEPHSPIRIINNSDFETQAAIENWLGNGSELTPYMIQGIAITGPTDQNLIEIWNTTIHFQIRDCYLTQGDTGIYLRNVTNGHVFNNTITKNINRGIFLSDSENSIITNNTVTHNNITGIEIFITNNIKISGNIVSNNQGMGVVLYYSRKSIIQDNIISDNNEEGICLSMPGVRYKVTGNTIINNSRGIYLINTNYNTINGNIIANNRGNGIELYRSSNTRVAGNIVENNSEYGIAIPHVDLCGQSCAFNTIQFNNFVRNNLGGDSQAYDASSPLMLYTNFEFNYWDEWTNLTQSYSIAGEANATDSSPRMIPNHLLFGVITYPTYRWPEPLFGIVPIQWTPTIDLLGHNITYSVFYSISDGEVWLPVEQGIETPFYAWDTRSMIDW